jgi:hypothetical protein
MISFAKNDDLYDLMAELIVSSATVFLSIFLIFTVTQNQVLHSDRKMFESGILQRYYADDRHLAIMAVLTIFFAIASAMMAKISQQPPIKNWSIQQVVLLDRHVVLGFVYGVSLVFLFDTFLSIVNYYLGRTRDLVERDIVGYILHEDLLKYCPEAQAHKDEITP